MTPHLHPDPEPVGDGVDAGDGGIVYGDGAVDGDVVDGAVVDGDGVIDGDVVDGAGGVGYGGIV